MIPTQTVEGLLQGGMAGMIWGGVATQWNIGLAMREESVKAEREIPFRKLLMHNVKSTGLNFAIIAGTFNGVKSVSQLLRQNKQDWKNSWAAGLVAGAVLITRIRGSANSIQSLVSLAGFSLWTSALAGGLHFAYLDLPKKKQAKSFDEPFDLRPLKR